MGWADVGYKAHKVMVGDITRGVQLNEVYISKLGLAPHTLPHNLLEAIRWNVLMDSHIFHIRDKWTIDYSGGILRLSSATGGVYPRKSMFTPVP